MSEKNNFRFFIPIDSIVKAKDAKGKTVMKMAGIASTKRRDTDGEVLHPNGFDISYLKEKGIVNWNHQRSPDDIIGEPAIAEIRKEGLFIESQLYSESKKAKQVYNLAEVLKKSNAKRRLGYSVEGKAIERDPTDPSQVTKAMITNVAITISPKNPDSSIDIVKGNYQEWADDEKPPVLEAASIDDLLKGVEDPQDAIIDITRPDGKRVTVDSKYNVKIQKAETQAEEEEEEVDESSSEKKALNTTSGAAVIPEHVDGETKNMLNGGPQKASVKKGEGNAEDTNYLTEDEVLVRIMKSNSVITFSKANEILQTLNDFTMKQGKTTKISEDLLEKSLATLGLKNDKKKITKAEKEEGGEEEEDDDETEENEQEEGKTPGKNKKKGMKKANTISKKYKDEDEYDDEEDEEEEDRDEEDNKDEKPEGSAKNYKHKGVKKSVRTNIRKSEPEYDTELAEILAEEMTEAKGMLKSVGILVKGCYDAIGELREENAELRQQIEAFGNAPANGGARSVRKAVDRDFQKGMGTEDTIQKSEDGRIKVDVTKARNQVLNMMDAMTYKNGVYNEEMGKATQLFEASGTMQPNIQKAIENEFKISLYKNL